MDEDLNEALAGPVPFHGVLDARIVRMDEVNVWVDIGAKYDASLPRAEWDADEPPPAIGATVCVVVQDDFNVDDRPLQVVRVWTTAPKSPKAWASFELYRAFISGASVTCPVSACNDRGFEIVYAGCNMLLPWRYVTETMRSRAADFVGQQIRIRFAGNAGSDGILVRPATDEVDVMNLALIGYRGTGKTTVAQELARRLAWQWVDADVELERRAGRTIKQIFAKGGEQSFRDLEAQIVAEVCARDQVIIALGGGAILRPENRAAIKARCQAAWLTAAPATILQRIETDATTAERRPNLTAAGGLAEIEQLLAAREPFYRECADCIVATDHRSPESIAADILASLDPALGMTK